MIQAAYKLCSVEVSLLFVRCRAMLESLLGFPEARLHYPRLSRRNTIYTWAFVEIGKSYLTNNDNAECISNCLQNDSGQIITCQPLSGEYTLLIPKTRSIGLGN